MAHQWRFFRSGGFDQVRLDKIEDWQHLSQLDPKLWAALDTALSMIAVTQQPKQKLQLPRSQLSDR